MESPVEVALGSQEAILSVAVFAYPEPELVWYRGGIPIDPEDRHYDMRYRQKRSITVKSFIDIEYLTWKKYCDQPLISNTLQL